jgi:hypothetical protein
MVSFIGGENMSMKRKPPTSHKVTGKLYHGERLVACLLGVKQTSPTDKG